MELWGCTPIVRIFADYVLGCMFVYFWPTLLFCSLQFLLLFKRGNATQIQEITNMKKQFDITERERKKYSQCKNWFYIWHCYNIRSTVIAYIVYIIHGKYRGQIIVPPIKMTSCYLLHLKVTTLNHSLHHIFIIPIWPIFLNSGLTYIVFVVVLLIFLGFPVKSSIEYHCYVVKLWAIIFSLYLTAVITT